MVRGVGKALGKVSFALAAFFILGGPARAEYFNYDKCVEKAKNFTKENREAYINKNCKIEKSLAAAARENRTDILSYRCFKHRDSGARICN